MVLVISRSHGTTQKRFYGCAHHVERGICDNKQHVPMADADEIVLEALLDDVLDDDLVAESVDEALRLVQGDGAADHCDQIDREIGPGKRPSRLNATRSRLAGVYGR